MKLIEFSPERARPVELFESVGALYPALRAARQDAVDALSYE